MSLTFRVVTSLVTWPFVSISWFWKGQGLSEKIFRLAIACYAPPPYTADLIFTVRLSLITCASTFQVNWSLITTLLDSLEAHIIHDRVQKVDWRRRRRRKYHFHSPGVAAVVVRGLCTTVRGSGTPPVPAQFVSYWRTCDVMRSPTVGRRHRCCRPCESICHDTSHRGGMTSALHVPTTASSQGHLQ